MTGRKFVGGKALCTHAKLNMNSHTAWTYNNKKDFKYFVECPVELVHTGVAT